MTEELTVAELATLAKFSSPGSLLAKLLRIYHAQTELIAELQECLDVETPILPDAEGKPTPEFIEALTDALREYGEESAAPAPGRCDECGVTHGPGNTNTLCPLASNYRWPAEPEPSVDNRDELLACARSWEPEVRLLGNVRACTIAKICVDAESVEAQLEAVRRVFTDATEPDCVRRYWRIRALLTTAAPEPSAKRFVPSRGATIGMIEDSRGAWVRHERAESAESAEAQLAAVLQALGIYEDVRCGRDPVEAARSIIKESCLAGDAWSRLFEAEAQLAAVQCALLDPYSNNELRIANAHKALAPADSQDTKD